ncbi:hypothetical protein D1B32_07390 [Oceanobacillus profundus]|uniref:Uncharacterized protein n=2 Tax=Bacillaceae TaxID=186817 RepID=A0A417YIM3_9BACI|nr:hypothetical protein CHI07_02115 [Paenibacillus sp. 7884-2]RHW32863.1 hypothetical protein D1B32_07390 [Oceanobacillus profundus]
MDCVQQSSHAVKDLAITNKQILGLTTSIFFFDEGTGLFCGIRKLKSFKRGSLKMENEEVKMLKRELHKEIIVLKNEQKSFKRRVSTIANIIIPGIGFVFYGSSFLKALIFFLLFFSYNIIYFNNLYPLIGGIGIAIIYYIPAVIIWFVSTIMVASLDD